MLIIHYNVAFKALDTYVQKHNLLNGKDRSKQVRQSVSSTAKELIRIYGASLVKANTIQKLDIENLPSLRTNNAQLAKLSHSSTRTMQRHITKLIEAGVVTKKVWHGSNASYELWINPEILLVKDQMTPKSAQKIVKQALLKRPQNTLKEYVDILYGTTCPHTESHNSINNNILIAVDKSVETDLKPSDKNLRKGLSGNTGGNNVEKKELNTPCQTDLNILSGNTGGNITPKKELSTPSQPRQYFLSGNTGGNNIERNHDAGGNKRDLRTLSGNKKKSDDARSAALSQRIDMLWMLAKKVLYKDVLLTEYQENSAKRLLEKWYEPVESQYLSKVHQIYVERIGLARKYVSKNPVKRYVQLPDRYFDLDNSNGFRGTKKWWEADQKRKQEVKLKLILKAQIRRFINNQRKTDATRKPALALFRDCEQRIGKLNKPQLLSLFHQAVLNPNNQSFIN